MWQSSSQLEVGCQTAEGDSIDSVDAGVTFADRLPQRHSCGVGIVMKKRVHSKDETLHFFFDQDELLMSNCELLLV